MSNGKLFNLNIVSPGGRLFTGEADIVIVPGEMGELGILANHTSLLSTLKPGVIRVKKGAGLETFQISDGFIEVDRNKVTILATPREG